MAVRPPPAPTPLRSDVAAFVGPTHRGPVGEAVRVEGWRAYQAVFGGLDGASHTPYAVRGYFENGGTTAFVVRVAGGAPATATAGWTPAPPMWAWPVAGVVVAATSPGAWARGLEVEVGWRREGAAFAPEVDVVVRPRGAPAEALLGLPVERLPEAVAARSELVRLAWAGDDVAPDTDAYLGAADRLVDEPDVALIALPDLHAEPGLDVARIVTTLLGQAEALHDRLVLIDAPRDRGGRPWHADQLIADWLEAGLGRTADALDDVPWRAGAHYHPWLRVDDPLGGVHRPLRTIPPCGHVAGMISALDRRRGAHHTPANEPLLGVVDLEAEASPAEYAVLNEAGVDLVRCVPGLGYAAMGGRTLDPRPDRRWVAHRRLLHRLVRALRKVAEPLVFEGNGPALWFQFVRAVTSVLLEAWRSGALAGAAADEAFTVQCDLETNPPDEVERGRCVCLIGVAPAVPMEMIELRVALSRDGALEVLP
ncbi:MAG: phage tail sheath family protein [Kofleriaceae bacterium]|nr:phage tail sheath family protein [Kofleriaceae bacterium]